MSKKPSKKRKAVPTFHAPPDDAFGMTVGRQSGNQRGYDSSIPTRDDREEPRKSRKKELDDIYAEVKALSSTTYTGMAKKKKKEDVLTRLGVNAPKQQTMPLRMAMGIKAGRERRERKAREHAKESGVLTSLGSKKNKNRRDRNDDEGRTFSVKNGDVGSLDVHTKKGIMHLSSKRVKSYRK